MRSKKVLHWDDERDIGNCIIVTLKQGYAFEPHSNSRMAEHVRGFDDYREAVQGVKDARKCFCDDCKNNT